MSITDIIPWKWGKKNEITAKNDEKDDPFSKLQRRMNSLFDDFWDDLDLSPARKSLFGKDIGFAPSIDLKESDKDIVLRAELPGMDDSDIDVNLSNGILTVKGEKKAEKKQEEKDGVFYSECSYGSFCRSISLPCDVEEDKVKAEFKNGVLTINLPKTAEAKEKTKRITVQRG